MKQRVKRLLWLDFLLIFLIPVVGMALGVGVTFLFGINQTNYSNLIVNLFFLLACIVLVRTFNLALGDLGLRLIKEQVKKHVLLSLTIFALYILFYFFVIRISALKPFSAGTIWGLLTYAIVVIAEELYFRGALYAFIEKRFSVKAALVVSSLVFGLFHAQQGMRSTISRVFTGWLWGSVRYSTGMIFLLIFPIHFTYNAVWLLFEGNWSNPPGWAIYSLPALEFMLGLAIILIRKKQSEPAIKA